MRKFPSLRGLIEDALAAPVDALRSTRAMRELANLLAQAPAEKARYFLPGLSWPASKILTVGQLGAIAPGSLPQDTSIQIQSPGVVVGIMISGRGLSDLSMEVEAANLTWQLTRESSIATAANVTQATSAGAADGYASVRGMTSCWPWMPLVIPARGAGGWTISIRNIHPTERITPLVNIAFLDGLEAYELACASLSQQQG